jgi:DNA excision repair protein ERCC-2
MYSAVISEDDIRNLRKKLSSYKPSIRSLCNKAIEIFDKYHDLLAEKALYVSTEMDNELNKILRNIKDRVDEIFNENKVIKNKDEILEVYFKILDFIRISEYFCDTHRLLGKIENDSVSLSYTCLDASKFILSTINESIHGITFFSATLYPITYYMDLLTKGFGNFINLPSPFDPNNLKIIINKEISTKYNDRENSVDTIIEAIESLAQNEGNYIIFFPSYAYLKMVYEKLEEPNFECIVQKNNMTEDEKDEIIEKFKTTTNTKFGFFVMGGVFSEGIDFIGDALSGVIIVGVGLPLVCDENNILKEYFEEKYPQKGFDYAYMYPGFTKVIQAVGRVIRDEDDRGVAILMDNRFIHLRYQELMPNHWKNIKVITNNYSLKKELKK